MDLKGGPPHYDLEELKELLRNEETRVITQAARLGAEELGLIDDDEIVDACLRLSRKELYKTMTAKFDPTLWQDVYRQNEGGAVAYIKLQRNHDGKEVIIQFKPK